MRILLAGSIDAGNALEREIESYLGSSYQLTINTFYLDKSKLADLQGRYGQNASVKFCEFDPSVSAELQSAIVDKNIGYDAIVYPPNIEGFTPEIVSAATHSGLQNKLQVIGCPNDATSHLAKVFETATQQGVAIIHTPGIHANAVAEYTLSQMGFHTRKIGELYHRTGENGVWPHVEATTTTHSLDGKTLGVLGGSGNDGVAVITHALKMGLRVVAMGSGRAESDDKILGLGAEVAPNMEALLRQSDFISVNCRKNNQTIGFISAASFALMKSDVIIINPAGAEIIDKQALLDEFSKPSAERKVGAVILDMPYGGRRDNKAFMADEDNAKLKELGVLFTPRMAGYTIETREQGVTDLAGYIKSVLTDKNYDVPIANKDIPQAAAAGHKSAAKTAVETLDESNSHKFMEDLIALAREGGEIAIKLRQAGLITESILDGSPTTNADIAVTKHLYEGLLRKGYHFCFSGEEQVIITNPDSNIQIVIDGIDGTRNFRDGNYGWCISVAAKRDGQTIAAMVYDPKCDETYWAIKGAGAYFADRHSSGQFRVPESHPEDFSFSVGSFRIKGSTLLKAKLIDGLKEMGGREREWGSVALSICMAARGGLGSFIQGNSKEHDHVAALLIAQEAGAGVVSTPSKEAGRTDIIVAHPNLKDRVVASYERRIATITNIGPSTD